LSVSPACGLAVVLCLVCVTSLWFGCGSVPCLCHQPVVSSDIEFPNIDDCLENYLKVFTVTVTNTEDRNKCMFPSFLSIQSESAGSTRVNIHRAMNLPWLSYVKVGDEVRRKRGGILTNTKSCASFLWTCTIPRARRTAFGNKSSEINLSCYFIRIELGLLVCPNLWTRRHRRRYDLIWPELKPPFHFIAKPDWNRILGFLCFVSWKYSRPSFYVATDHLVGIYRAFLSL